MNNFSLKQVYILSIGLILILGISIALLLSGTSGESSSTGTEEPDLLSLPFFADDIPEASENPLKKGITRSRRKMIEAVRIEPNPACVGDDVVVRAKVNDTPGVKISVGRNLGNPAIIRTVAPGTREVYVTADNGNNEYDLKKLVLNVKKCPDRPRLKIDWSLSTERQGVVFFYVRGAEGLGSDFQLNWDFDDGRTQTSSGRSTVAHDYGFRKQDTPASNYIVKVTGKDGSGKTVDRKIQVTLRNSFYFGKLAGNHSLPAEYDRFSGFQKDGKFKANIRVKNIEEQNAHLEKVDIVAEGCEAGERNRVTLGAREFFASTTAAKRSKLAGTFRLPEDLVQGELCRVTFHVRGRMENGKPLRIHASYSNPAGDSLGSRKVTDTAEVEKLNRAAKILKKKVITPDDLRRLEKEGRI